MTPSEKLEHARRIAAELGIPLDGMDRLALPLRMAARLLSVSHSQVEKLVAYGYLECRRSDYNVVQYRLTDMAYDAGCGERPTVD